MSTSPSTSWRVGQSKIKKLPPRFLDSNELVTFVIGKEEKKFIVHKAFACHTVQAFNAAFNSTFIEGQTKIYRLDDTTERAFSLLVEWIYSRSITVVQLDDSLRDSWDIESELGATWKVCENGALLELWILAEKLILPKLQNLAAESIYQIQRTNNSFRGIEFLHYVYENTSDGSELRRLIVDIICSTHEGFGFRGNGHEIFPHRFLFELAQALMGSQWGKLSEKTGEEFYVEEEA